MFSQHILYILVGICFAIHLIIISTIIIKTFNKPIPLFITNIIAQTFFLIFLIELMKTMFTITIIVGG